MSFDHQRHGHQKVSGCARIIVKTPKGLRQYSQKQIALLHWQAKDCGCLAPFELALMNWQNANSILFVIMPEQSLLIASSPDNQDAHALHLPNEPAWKRSAAFLILKQMSTSGIKLYISSVAFHRVEPSSHEP